MTVSIFTTLSMLPSGKVGLDLSADDLGRYLREHYGTIEEKQRNDRHALRDVFYRDGGIGHMQGLINTVFKDDKVRELRKQFVEHARFNNALKRIINELSTVYAEPAIRTVDGGPANATAYQAVLDEVQMDEQMLQLSRMLNLHRALLVQFRVSQHADGTRAPTIDVITPANARAVMHPNDCKMPIGWLIRTAFKPADATANTPAWVLWSDHERVYLRDDMSPMMETHVEHGLGVCPVVPISLSPPCPGFWPGEEGEDLVAAHRSIWLVNVMMLKEAKSATKITHATGDMTAAARGQVLDSEGFIETPDGTAFNTLDMSMDLGPFRDTADHILASAGQNYGMPGAVLTHQGTQSADARELLRLPLKELRKQQQIPLRRFEKRFAIVMAKVLAADLPELAFDPVGWRIDFAEVATPLNPTDQLDLFLKRRAAGVANTIDYLRDLNPDLTDDQAEAYLERCAEIEYERRLLLVPKMALDGSMAQVKANDQAEMSANDNASAESTNTVPTSS